MPAHARTCVSSQFFLPGPSLLCCFIAMSDESSMDWNLCVICQKTSDENLRCPLRNCSDVYSAFLSNVEEFRELDCLPVNNFGNQGTVESFTHNKAS